MRPQLTVLGRINSSSDLARWTERNARILGRNVSYGTSMSNKDSGINLDIWKATGTTPSTANLDFTIQHSLNRVPITIVGQDTNNGGVLYRSPVIAWTKTTITLRCTTSSAGYNVIVT